MSQPYPYGNGYPHPAPPSAYPTHPTHPAQHGQQGFAATHPHAQRAGAPPNAHAAPLLRTDARGGMPQDPYAVPLPPSPTNHFHPDMYGMPRPTLYRKGNATSPQFDRVRPMKDIVVTDQGNVLPNTGGLSTDAVVQDGWKHTQTWVLPDNAPLGDRLVATNNEGTHWLMAPAHETPFDQYKADLAALNHQATRFDKYGRPQPAPAPAPAKAPKPQRAQRSGNKAPQPGKGPASAGQSSSRR
ncbi:hypothetical protein AURDEDRAFT_121434 [Auricularia subglabra TFB-10046 SS5]|nr:hypothetical protein AURDEDRAFT_121434 [Auricularia subglabra TFB-10046 SS5]